MRQSSEAFMDELLKDNQQPASAPVTIDAEYIAKVIDENMEKALAKYHEQVSKVNPPAAVEPPEETEEISKEGVNTDGQQDNGESDSDS